MYFIPNIETHIAVNRFSALKTTRDFKRTYMSPVEAE